MAREYFKRMRNGALRGGTASAPDPDRTNPWEDAPAGRLSDLATPATESSDARSEAYANWAQRMQDKRARTQERIAADSGGASDEPASYWSAEAVYAESRRVDEEELTERPNPWRRQELLAVLDLTDGASKDDVGLAYKKLAKAHHPDRYAMADEPTQQYHADRMMSINKAYRALRQLELA